MRRTTSKNNKDDVFTRNTPNIKTFKLTVEGLANIQNYNFIYLQI
jgi:hypothetical protein